MYIYIYIYIILQKYYIRKKIIKVCITLNLINLNNLYTYDSDKFVIVK